MDLIPGRQKLTPRMKEAWEADGARTRIAAARRGRGIRQQDFAEAIGVSTATLREIEAGRVGPGVSISVLLAAAVVLEVPLSALIEDQWVAAAETLKSIPEGQRMYGTIKSRSLKLPPP